MFRTIECTQLDFDDTTFLMSYPLESPALIASVETIGVLQPIVVRGRPCEEKYQIVAGFRRAHACRELDLPIIHTNIHQVDPADMLPAFCLALHENLAHRTFNDVEKSLIFTKLLRQFGCAQDDIIRNYMPLLQLSPNENGLKTYLKIVAFEEDITHYIATHELPMTMLKLLANLSSEDCRAVFTFISKLKLGINKLKELLTYLDEIALRDNCSIYQVLDDRRIHEILDHEKYTGPQKIEQIRRIIREKRYPQLTTLEHEYHARLKQLHLPRGLQLKTDRFFEDDELSATFRFNSPEQLKTFAEQLLCLSQKPELQKVLDLIQGY